MDLSTKLKESQLNRKNSNVNQNMITSFAINVEVVMINMFCSFVMIVIFTAVTPTAISNLMEFYRLGIGIAFTAKRGGDREDVKKEVAHPGDF